MKSLSTKFTAMGGPCQIYLLGKNERQLQQASNHARQEVYRLEKKYSRYRVDSVISAINQQAGSEKTIPLDEETAGLINYAAQCFKQSEGLFDITSGILRNAWNFHAQQAPTQKQIDELLPLIGWYKVNWQAPYIELPIKGMQIDFGGFVKEYAADASAKLCQDNGIHHGYIDLGGDIAVVGPTPDNTPWPLGVRHPQQQNTAIANIELYQGGLATSGDYERFIQVGSKKYSHLLNPSTGWPLESEQSFASVSITADQCLIAGTAATIAMLKGCSTGEKWLQKLGLPYLLVHQDMQVTSSP